MSNNIYSRSGKAVATLMEMTNSIFSPINKTFAKLRGDETVDHAVQIAVEKSTNAKELALLARGWVDQWENKSSQLVRRQEAAYKYWRGTQTPRYTENIDMRRRVSTNVIFECVETLLPAATKNNPEVYVTMEDESDAAKEYTALMTNLLNAQGKTHGLKFHIRDATRNWLTNFIGGIGIGYNIELDNFEIAKIDAKRFIFDTEGHVMWNGLFNGRYIGCIRTMEARIIKKLFKDSEKYVDGKTGKNDGTNLDIIEWWTQEKVFFTDGNCEYVFGEMQYPHWNYTETTNEEDEFGVEYSTTHVGYNYLKRKEFPFVFITQLNTGKYIHDDTSLIEQSMGPQDIIDKRMAQADINADSMNNGFVVSGEYFQQEQAAEFGRALAEGDVGFIPQKQIDSNQSYDLQQAYRREQALPLPPDIYNQIATAKTDIRSTFGTFGLTPESQQKEQTVRGKLVLADSDASRIGGGLVEILENRSATIYMWMLQMMYVYYDIDDYTEILGVDKATRFMELQQQFLKVCPEIWVREGSLLSQNPVTRRNEAIDLFQMGVLDPLTLFEDLDYANPQSTLMRLISYQTDPASLLQTAGTPDPNLLGMTPVIPAPAHSGGGNDAYDSSIPTMGARRTASMGR